MADLEISADVDFLELQGEQVFHFYKSADVHLRDFPSLSTDATSNWSHNNLHVLRHATFAPFHSRRMPQANVWIFKQRSTSAKGNALLADWHLFKIRTLCIICANGCQLPIWPHVKASGSSKPLQNEWTRVKFHVMSLLYWNRIVLFPIGSFHFSTVSQLWPQRICLFFSFLFLHFVFNRENMFVLLSHYQSETERVNQWTTTLRMWTGMEERNQKEGHSE